VLSAKSADWAFHADDAAVLDALANGGHAGSLREYFGAPAYAELSALAASAKAIKKSPGPRVLILPGIMGSKLGGPIRPGARSTVLWIDPLQIAAGRLTALTLPSGKSLEATGVLLFSYARLKLQLQIAGCDVSFYPYDWRLGLDGRQHGRLVGAWQLDVEHNERGIPGADGVEHADAVGDGADTHPLGTEAAQHRGRRGRRGQRQQDMIVGERGRTGHRQQRRVVRGRTPRGSDGEHRRQSAPSGSR